MDQNLTKKLRIKEGQKKLLISAPTEYINWAPEINADTKTQPGSIMIGLSYLSTIRQG